MCFRRLFIITLAIWPLISLAYAGSAQGQSPVATIAGTVTDSSGGTVAGATVKATNQATNQVWTAVSNATGEFQIQPVPGGAYSVEVSAKGFQVFRSGELIVAGGTVYSLPVKLQVEGARSSVVVNAEATDDFKPAMVTLGNLTNASLQELPVSALVFKRTLLDDQQARLLSDVAKNDASVGEDYAPVGWYQDFTIRGFTLDLASGFKINGLAAAGEQLFALENKESVEFLHGVDSDEVGVASGGGLINYVTKRPAIVRTVTVGTDQRGSFYSAVDLGTLFGAQQQ